MKKGQISIFIILGVVLIAVAGLLYYLSIPRQMQEPTIPNEFLPVYTYFEQCIKDKSIPAIQLLGIQGGHIYLPEDYLEADYSNISYGFFKERYSLVSIAEMESELSRYMSDNIPLCKTDFPGILLEYGNVSAISRVLGDKVVFEIDYDLKATKGNITKEIRKFNVISPIRLGYVQSVVSQIVNKTLSDPDWIDMTYLSGFDVKVDILPYNDSVLVYSVYDNKTAEPFTFLSAFSYKVNKAPVITSDSPLILLDGVPFITKLNVSDPEGDNFECSDDTALFDITDDCKIILTPEIPGSYNVTITAEDIRGNRADKKIEFIVKEK